MFFVAEKIEQKQKSVSRKVAFHYSLSTIASTMIWRILLVEDEEHILEALKLNLEAEGYEVVAVTNGVDALKAFKEQRFNLAILDVMLPEMDGFQVCEQIRLENSSIPVLFLTAKDSTQDKINGFKKGGDDYLTKPFNLDEFLLRVKVLLRHSIKGTERRRKFANLFVWPKRNQLCDLQSQNDERRN